MVKISPQEIHLSQIQSPRQPMDPTSTIWKPKYLVHSTQIIPNHSDIHHQINQAQFPSPSTFQLCSSLQGSYQIKSKIQNTKYTIASSTCDQSNISEHFKIGVSSYTNGGDRKKQFRSKRARCAYSNGDIIEPFPFYHLKAKGFNPFHPNHSQLQLTFTIRSDRPYAISLYW